MKRKIFIRTAAAVAAATLTCILGAFARGQTNDTNHGASPDQMPAPETGLTQRLRNIVKTNESTATQGVPGSAFTQRLRTIVKKDENAAAQGAPANAWDQRMRNYFLRRYGLLLRRPHPAPGAGATASAEANKEVPYLVQDGDTLDKLAALFGVSVQAIEDANPGLSLAGLKPGQQVMIPTEATSQVTPPPEGPHMRGRGVMVPTQTAMPGAQVPADVQEMMKVMVDRIREAKADAERKSAEEQLRALLDGYFDRDMARRQHELTTIEKRVDKLRSLLAKRREAKASIVGLQYQVLVNEAEGLGFLGEEAADHVSPPGANPQSSAASQPESAVALDQTGHIVHFPQALSTAAAPLKSALGSDLRELALGLKEYALDHQDAFPDTLEDTARYLEGGTNFLSRVVTTDGGEYLIYIRAPGQVGDQHPDRVAILVPASGGCWVARCDGSVMLSRKTAATLLLEECREIGTDQPGTTATVSGNAIGQRCAEDMANVLKGAGIFVTELDATLLPKRIRIRLTGPNSGSK